MPEVPGRRARTDDGLWPDHVEAMRAFLSVASQWREVVFPNGVRRWTGLDYAGVQAGLALAGLSVPPETWEEVRQIEAGAIEELNRVG